MRTLEWVGMAASVAGLVSGGGLLLVSFRGLCRSPDDKIARFMYGHLAVFGVAIGLAGGLGVVAVASPYFGSSWLAFVAITAVNLIFQPVALLICWTAMQKIHLGMCGYVAYAWRRIPESELMEVSPAGRRALSRYCLFQGLVALPVGGLFSFAFGGPLLLWALNSIALAVQ